MLPIKKGKFQKSVKKFFLILKVLIIKEISRNTAAIKNAEGNKNNPK